MEIDKILIQWIEVGEDGEPKIQIRKYKDATKAKDFMETLPSRGVKKCVKKEEITLDRVVPGQISMDIDIQ